MKEFVTCALTGISVPTDCSSEYCMKCLSCEPAKQYAKDHATLPQLLKAADSRSAVQDAINNREEIKPNTFEKEIKTMNETTYTNEDYIIKDKITSTIMNTVCSMAINFNRLPVDLGFKLNNLNATEFKLYAKLLYRHVLDNATPFYEYPDKQAHDKAFYNFRDKNKHLVDDSRTVPTPASKPEYHIPTDTDIKFRNDAELLALAMQTIEELSKRILTAREAVKNDAELVDTIISQLPKPRKTSVK